jgi:hypothetical protein
LKLIQKEGKTQMTKIGPDFFSAAKDEIINFVVESVNMDSNADLDPLLNPVVVNNFKTTGQFTMGDAGQTFVISYGFPDNAPDGKYQRTISSDDLTDGPLDIKKPAGQNRIDVGYEFQFSAGEKVVAAGGKQNEPGE